MTGTMVGYLIAGKETTLGTHKQAAMNENELAITNWFMTAAVLSNSLAT